MGIHPFKCIFIIGRFATMKLSLRRHSHIFTRMQLSGPPVPPYILLILRIYCIVFLLHVWIYVFVIILYMCYHSFHNCPFILAVASLVPNTHLAYVLAYLSVAPTTSYQGFSHFACLHQPFSHLERPPAPGTSFLVISQSHSFHIIIMLA